MEILKKMKTKLTLKMLGNFYKALVQGNENPTHYLVHIKGKTRLIKIGSNLNKEIKNKFGNNDINPKRIPKTL